MTHSCRLCGVTVRPSQSGVLTRREVDLDENRRKGVNAVSDVGPVIGYTCFACAEKRRLHIPVGQQGLAI